jgi:hypothetical protein
MQLNTTTCNSHSHLYPKHGTTHSITNTTTNNNMYHAHDELQKTTTRGLEMYWAYAGRTNNNNKISLSEMLTILASSESDEDTKSNLV